MQASSERTIGASALGRPRACAARRRQHVLQKRDSLFTSSLCRRSDELAEDVTDEVPPSRSA